MYICVVKYLIRNVLIHITLLIIYFFVWILIFRVLITKQDITVIAGIWSTIFATIVVSCLIEMLKRRRKQKGSRDLNLNLLSVILICLFSGISFLFTVPAINDRSLSIYLTSSINSGNLGVSKQELEEFVNDDWNKNNIQLRKRIQEQEQLNNIKLINDNYFCPTIKLKLYLTINEKVSTLLGIDMRYLEGSESILSVKKDKKQEC